MVAAGLAGPARAAVGGVRDYLLGATLLNGRAELLSFGGQVMKNVAGYDVSRALAGSMGVLGVICEVSLKVLPVVPATATVRLELDAAAALRRVNEWAGQPLPLNASAWWDGMLLLRPGAARARGRRARPSRGLGGERIDDGAGRPVLARPARPSPTSSSPARAHHRRQSGHQPVRLSLPQTGRAGAVAGRRAAEASGAGRSARVMQGRRRRATVARRRGGRAGGPMPDAVPRRTTRGEGAFASRTPSGWRGMPPRWVRAQASDSDPRVPAGSTKEGPRPAVPTPTCDRAPRRAGPRREPHPTRGRPLPPRQTAHDAGGRRRPDGRDIDNDPMQTNSPPSSRDTREGDEAEAILRKCVHCGFCTATCPPTSCSATSSTGRAAAST
jgi:ferredoxin